MKHFIGALALSLVATTALADPTNEFYDENVVDAVMCSDLAKENGNETAAIAYLDLLEKFGKIYVDNGATFFYSTGYGQSTADALIVSGQSAVAYDLFCISKGQTN